MEEQHKKWEAKKDSPQRSHKRRRRVTVAEKLMERKNSRTNHPSLRQEIKTAKSMDNRDDRSHQPCHVGDAKERGTKQHGRNQSRSEEHRNAQSDFARRSCGAIPDRWLQYQIAINRPMENTCFLAFKTPLGSMFFDGKKLKDRQEHRFEVETVLDHVNSLERSLGMVIDLTNTNRYYDGALWSQHKVQYVKIRCPGHEVSEDESFYQHFRTEVKQFFGHCGNKDKLVGVHCTHGLNRTGYLICRYLIEEYGWSADNAIESFRVARGYPMERPKYIESLKEAERKLAILQVDVTKTVNLH